MFQPARVGLVRGDFGHNAEGKAAALSLGPERIDGIRKMLDQAIASTKDVIPISIQGKPSRPALR